MKPLHEGEQEVDYRSADNGRFEVQFVWNHIIEAAYVKVEDHRTSEEYVAMTPDGTHPKEAYIHPNVFRVGENALQDTVEFEAVDGRGDQ